MAELTPHDLQAHILAAGIAARLVRDMGDTSTVPLAAAALGVEPHQIIKSLLFLVRLPDQPDSPQPVLVIVDGSQRVDHKAIAAHFGVSRKRVRLASADEVLAILGYPAGGVPPLAIAPRYRRSWMQRCRPDNPPIAPRSTAVVATIARCWKSRWANCCALYSPRC